MYLSFLGVKHICRSDHLWRGYLHHQTIIHIIQNITKISTGRFEIGIVKKIFESISLACKLKLVTKLRDL